MIFIILLLIVNVSFSQDKGKTAYENGNYNDARLYYEDIGQGSPIIFIHEFAGDYRSWGNQIQHLNKNNRCVKWNSILF